MVVEHELPPARRKIVATIGPAFRAPAALRQLIHSGATIVRLASSHGTHAEHTAVFADRRASSARDCLSGWTEVSS